MAWTDGGGLRPSREEVLAQVVARGRALRRRRHAIIGTAAGLLVVVLALPAAALIGRGNGSTTQVRASGATTTTLGTRGVIAPDTTVASDTTATTPLTAPPTTPAPVTSVPKTTPPTVRRSTTTSVGHRACTADDFAVGITFTYPGALHFYQPGQTVMARATLRKASPGTCDLGGGFGVTITFSDATGKSVGVTAIIADPAPGSDSIPVPEGLFDTQTAQWDQQGCGGLCPPGTYSVTAAWSLPEPSPPGSTALPARVTADGSATFVLAVT